MGPKLEFLLTADSAAVDAKGKLTAVGIFQNVTIPATQTSVTIPSFSIVGRILDVPPGNAQINVRILHQGRTFQELVLSGEATKKNLNFIAQFDSTVFSEKGEYKIEVFLNGSRVQGAIEHSFTVT